MLPSVKMGVPRPLTRAIQFYLVDVACGARRSGTLTNLGKGNSRAVGRPGERTYLNVFQNLPHLLAAGIGDEQARQYLTGMVKSPSESGMATMGRPGTVAGSF